MAKSRRTPRPLRGSGTPPSADKFTEFILGQAEQEAQETGNQSFTPYQREERWILLESIIGQLNQNREQRVKYAKRTFVLTCIWIAVVLLMVIANGLKILNGDKRV